MASTLMIIAIKEIGQIHGVKHGSCDAQVQAIDTEQLMKQYATFAQMLKKQKEPNELTGFKEGSEVLKNTM